MTDKEILQCVKQCKKEHPNNVNCKANTGIYRGSYNCKAVILSNGLNSRPCPYRKD